MKDTGMRPNPLDKPGYRLEINEAFDSSTLNTDLWLPYSLPHWSSRTRSATQYLLEDSTLVLYIDNNSQP